MKHLFVFVLLILTTSACSQEVVKIEKVCSSSGNENFISKNYRCKDLFFKDKDLISEVNYAYNGWQVYDSIYYEKTEKKICTKIFSPKYNEKKILESYILENIECNEIEFVISDDNIRRVKDDYYLSASYLKDLELLLESTPLKDNNNVFHFREGIKPSLFSEYGIPYNENLYSFTFTINNNLIENDYFLFENYEVKRNYKYNKRQLEFVYITVINKKKSNSLSYTEQYKKMM